MPAKIICILAIPAILILQVFIPLAMDMITSLFLVGAGFFLGLTWKQGDEK